MQGQSISNILPSGAHPAGLTGGVLKYVVLPEKVHLSNECINLEESRKCRVRVSPISGHLELTQLTQQ